MKISWSIFPKFYQHLSVQELAALIREVGLDTVNLVIRDGYWVTPGRLAEETKAFVKAMDREGLEIHFATAGFMPADIVKDDTPLAVLADNGITDFRLGYFRVENDDVRQSLADARSRIEQLVPICEKRGTRAVYQVHHGTLIPHSMAAWMLVRDLPSEAVGVMLDPGNQVNEGSEDWRRAAMLLEEHWVAMGVKDMAWRRNEAEAGDPAKGWRRDWVPLPDGVVNWTAVIDAMRAISFHGTFVFMPFYDTAAPAKMTQGLKREVAYLREMVDEV